VGDFALFYFFENLTNLITYPPKEKKKKKSLPDFRQVPSVKSGFSAKFFLRDFQ
jgi:hypothetical protein